MQAETFQYLLEWTTKFHNHMATCLEDALDEQQDECARWLMKYVAEHERTLATEVEGFKRQADPKALNTWLYEHLTETLPPNDRRKLPFGTMTFEEIASEVVDVHNQIINTYEAMANKAAIPEAQELMEEVMKAEQGVLRQMADRISSSREM
ncbi:hypothetical protein [Pseudomonas saliphila]|uniref:hypothetical protein n=1 Tax=Pseudomonas saliphila TaxID=2586906 RepID=UPI00123A224F|nr:hypothetical protein [Pseudomonas saliphila]